MKFDELPSFKHLNENVIGFKAIFKIYSFFRVFGLRNKKIDEAKKRFDELHKKIKEHKQSAVKFNKYFANDGWIIYDSLNSDFIKKAVEIFERKGKQDAQQLLLAYYSPDNIENKLFRLRHCKEFRVRLRFIEYALADYKAGRYYAAIPLLLMVIDGAVNDAIQKGFHAKSIDLDVWDAITSVDNGINIVKSIFQKARKRTTTESISFPYRHGILHGRDLSYDNYEVAAKTWHFLFIVHDWIRSKSTEKTRKEKFIKETTPPSFEELLKTVRNTKEVKDKLQEWRARRIDESYIKSINEGLELNAYLPEYIALEYLKLWCRKNFGHMADLYSSVWIDNPKKYAGELRELYNEWNINRFEFISIVDAAPAITEVIAKIVFEDGDCKKCCLRFIYETTSGDALPRNMKGANWKIVLKKIEEA